MKQSIRKWMMLGVAITVFFAGINCSAQSNSNTAINDSKQLVDYVAGETVFQKENDEMVTRMEFVHSVVKLMNISVIKHNEYSFKDVPAKLINADSVYTAVDCGYISEGKDFRPNENISRNDAMKIAVSALGYNFEALRNGGYPVGFLQTAQKIGITRNINQNDTLTVADAYNLLYNMLDTNIMKLVSYGDTIKYETSSRNLLYDAYGIIDFEGIITSTPYNSIIGTDSTLSKNKIAVNGVVFNYENVTADIIGLNCKVYGYEKDGIMDDVLLVVPRKNDQFSDLIRNVQIDDNDVILDDVKYSLSKNYSVFYNGKLSANKKIKDFSRTQGNIRLVDNNDDGYYELVFIEEVQYMVVGKVDTKNNNITDKYGMVNIDLSDKDCNYKIIDGSTNEELTLTDITRGGLLSIVLSADEKLVKIATYNGFVTGTIDEIQSTENRVKINDEFYYLSDYFIKNNSNKLAAGLSGTFYIGANNDIIDIKSTDEDFLYGYLLKIASDKGLDETCKMKVFSQNGAMEILPIIKRPIVDGNKLTIDFSKYLLTASGSNLKNKQLIRYKATNGSVTHIDIANASTSSDPVDYSTPRDNNNSLTQYSFGTYTYRSSSMSFAPFFSVEMSTVFYIPEDLDEKNFRITNNTVFITGKNYGNDGDTIIPYDIDSTGNASVVVFIDKASKIPYQTSLTHIVDKIVQSVDDDGDDISILYAWDRGIQKAYYVYDKNILTKPSGKTLSCGDVITFYANDNKILKINIDFDSDPAVFANLSGIEFNKDVQESAIMYCSGKVYSAGGNYLLVAYNLGNTGNVSYKSDNLRSYFLNASSLKSIIVYDTKKNKVRQGTINDIKPYIAYGDDASFIVFRQYSGLVNAILVYE